MRYNWLDFVLLGLVATVTAVQFLRAIKDFSRVMYETLLLIGAVVATNLLFKPVHDWTHVPYHFCFLGLFLLSGVLAFALAALLNTVAAFGMGAFSYVFGIIFALGSAYVIGHVVVRVPFMGYAHTHAWLFEAVDRSLLARDLLRFRTFQELLAILRIARWLNV